LLQGRFHELGPVAERFCDGLLRTQPQGKHQAQRVLALLSTYARADFLAALERAVRYGAYTYAAVERILAVQARPKCVLESLAEEDRSHLDPLLQDNPVPPRPLQDYEPLIDQEPNHHGQTDEATDDSPGPV
jgi:hypothetical protein